jgi:hypothetical protein
LPRISTGRITELRLAARDFVTDPGTQSTQIAEATTALSDVLKKTRLELAPEQQDMIDGVTERLATYRNRHRADLHADHPPRRPCSLTCRRCATSSMPRSPAAPDAGVTAELFQFQNRIAAALLAHNPSAAELAAQGIRAMAIADQNLRDAANAYAEAVVAISIRERQIAEIDKEVLGTEGRLIQRVTELLREVSAAAAMCCRAISPARWPKRNGRASCSAAPAC